MATRAAVVRTAHRQALVEIDVFTTIALNPTMETILTSLGPCHRKGAVGQRNHQ